MTGLLTSEALDRLCEHAGGRIDAGHTPGVAVAVTSRDGAESVLAVGHADIAGTPLRPDHAFQIGSISKSFAAICALQLEAEGVLSLDDAVADHLPWFSIGGGHGPIGLRHLLMHRSGLPVGADPGPSSPALVAELAAAETEWQPGERFWYSNIGYDTLGFALEARPGLPFPQLVRRRVLEPLGMHSSVAHIAAGDRRLLADGHEGSTRSCRGIPPSALRQRRLRHPREPRAASSHQPATWPATSAISWPAAPPGLTG
jgi:CubicO group peptidase (beta-lactamase class C family)